MADGLAWDDLTPELEGRASGSGRMDAGGLAVCLIRLEAGVTATLDRIDEIVKPGVTINPADTSYGEQVLQAQARRR